MGQTYVFSLADIFLLDIFFLLFIALCFIAGVELVVGVDIPSFMPMSSAQTAWM